MTTREETLMTIAVEMTIAEQIDDDGAAMLAVLNRHLDDAEMRGRNAPNVLTCVFCGHAYPPGSPTHGADVLAAHVKVCKKHPMGKYRRALEAIGKNTCGHEPLAAAYARGVLSEDDL